MGSWLSTSLNVLLSENIDLEMVADILDEPDRNPSVYLASSPRDMSAWHATNLIASADLIARGDVRYHEFSGPPHGIMSFGRIWEHAMDRYLAQWVAQRDGFYIPNVGQTLDGIAGSLDGIALLPPWGWVVIETKLRFSLRDDIPLSHLQQIRAYCHMADTDVVVYVSGHISSSPPTAIGRLRVLRMDQQSIRETWALVTATRNYLQEQGLGPPGNYHKEDLIEG